MKPKAEHPPGPDAGTDSLVAAWRTAWNNGRLPAFLLVAATLLIYLPALNGGFIWEDETWMSGLISLPPGLAGLKAIWFNPASLEQYYPLTATSFWIDQHLWGGWTAPYHLENILLHALGALLFWRLLRRLQVPGAGLAAAIFAFHPLMVESAAWITERKNVLSIVFFLGGLIAYGRFNQLWPNLKPANSEPSDCHRAYICAFLLFLLAIFAKTTAFCFPPALLLICWWQRGQIRWRHDVLPTLPFFAASIGVSLITAWVEKHHVGAKGAEWNQSLIERCLIAGRAVCFYAAKLIWPDSQCFIYPRWQIDSHSIAQWFFPAAAIVAVLTLWLLRSRLGRGPLTAVLFYVGALFPVMGFISVFFMRYSFVSDHWAYLPSLSLIALVAAAVTGAAERWRQPRLPFLFAAIILPALAFLSHRQSATYANAETIWRDTLRQNPASFLAHNNLGLILMGRNEFPEAVTHFQQGLNLHPGDPVVVNNLGYALFRSGKTDDAIVHFKNAIAAQPEYAKAWNNLGEAFVAKDRRDDAIAAFQKAVALQPAYPKARNSLGLALFQAGRRDEAVLQFQAALATQPDFDDARANLNQALAGTGKLDEMIALFQRDVAANPASAPARNNLGIALFQKGRVGDAIAQLRQALELQPDYPAAAENLARVAHILATTTDDSLRNGKSAVELAEQADKILRGTSPNAAAALAAAYAETGRFPDALATAQRGLQAARNQSNSNAVASLNSDLKNYEAGKPVRESAQAGAPR